MGFVWHSTLRENASSLVTVQSSGLLHISVSLGLDDRGQHLQDLEFSNKIIVITDSVLVSWNTRIYFLKNKANVSSCVYNLLSID